MPLLINLEPRLEELSRAVFENANDDLLAELSSYKSKLLQLRRVFGYHENLFRSLREHPPACFGGDDQPHVLTDIHDQAQRCVSLSTLHYDMVDNLQNAFIALASHRLNQIMRVLTIITVIFVPLSFLAGIYGMNFEHMPELSSKAGYFILLGVMATIAAGQLLLFRFRKWL